MHIWSRLAAASFIAALAAAVLVAALTKAGPAEVFLLCLAPFAAAWTGALIGGFLDWKRHGRSPFAPLLSGRFGWFYGRRYWVRLALEFAAAWALFIAFAMGVAVLSGASGEVRSFLSARGLLVILLFIVVFAAEGALIGGILDVVRYVRRKR